jgi:hypothetical protein
VLIPTRDQRELRADSNSGGAHHPADSRESWGPPDAPRYRETPDSKVQGRTGFGTPCSRHWCAHGRSGAPMGVLVRPWAFTTSVLIMLVSDRDSDYARF